jgi:hypothetical protein
VYWVMSPFRPVLLTGVVEGPRTFPLSLFTQVRGIGILRTSPFVHSRNFRFTEF